MPKVFVYKCSVHGEFEFSPYPITEELKEAYCPKCGAKMTKIGEYEEK